MVANKDESIVNIMEPNPAHETKQETDLCDSVTVQTAGEETGTGSLHGRVGIGIIHVDINASSVGVGYNGLRNADKSIGSDLAPIDRVVHGGLPDGDKGLGYVSVFPKCVAVSDDVILEENGVVLKEEFMFPVVVGSSCVKNADMFDPVSIGSVSSDAVSSSTIYYKLRSGRAELAVWCTFVARLMKN
ncbi:hypothetical protein PC128_g23454 [Phytophthora cactorum]|nr:hypothetical protein PC128_g23454 [Phytophthora cactorum]